MTAPTEPLTTMHYSDPGEHETIFLPVKIGREERLVEFAISGRMAHSKYIALGQLCPGGKLWPMALTAWPPSEQNPAWKVDTQFQRLRKWGRAVAWRDAAAKSVVIAGHISQHNGR